MGNGFFVKHILSVDQTIRYTGCDFSELMVDESINNNMDFVIKEQAKFTKANANKLPYKNEYFNKVFTVNTIYFWDKTETVLSEIKRVLKPNGLFVISWRPKSVMDTLPVTKYGFETFSESDCMELLTRKGFEIDHVAEHEDADIELNGEKFKNAYIIVRAFKK
jgi:ubiquinone/menaquinone biosynthesis C-methylase UbiE